MKTFKMSIVFVILASSGCLYPQDYVIKVSEPFSRIEVNEYNNGEYNNDNIRTINNTYNEKEKKIDVDTGRDFLLTIFLKTKVLTFIDKYTEKNKGEECVVLVRNQGTQDTAVDNDLEDDLVLEKYVKSIPILKKGDGIFKALNVVDISNPSFAIVNLYPRIDTYFKKLREKTRGNLVEQKFIVLHQTHSPDLFSAFHSFKESGIGANYYIDTNGMIINTISIDKICWHAGGAYSFMVRNLNSIGIEHVNDAYLLTPKRHTNYRKYLEENSKLTPHLIEVFSLLEKETKKWLRENYDQDTYDEEDEIVYVMYPDITGSQKRSSWLLINKLLNELNLDFEALIPHEFTHWKKPSEGLIILDFYLSRKAYEDNVKLLINELAINPGAFLEDDRIIIENSKVIVENLNLELNSVLKDDPSIVYDNNLIQRFYKNDNFYAEILRIEKLSRELKGFMDVVKILKNKLDHFLIKELPKHRKK